MHRVTWSVLVSFVAILSGCAPDVIQRPGEPDVVGVAADDDAMNAAMQAARDSYDTFLSELGSPEPTGHYSVKIRVDDGPEVEHIWLNELQLEGGALTGVVNNEPVSVSTVRLGDRVSVERERLSDWLIIDQGVYRGGFTIRVLRDLMSPDEREALDRRMESTPG